VSVWRGVPDPRQLTAICFLFRSALGVITLLAVRCRSLCCRIAVVAGGVVGLCASAFVIVVAWCVAYVHVQDSGDDESVVTMTPRTLPRVQSLSPWHRFTQPVPKAMKGKRPDLELDSVLNLVYDCFEKKIHVKVRARVAAGVALGCTRMRAQLRARC
jgi:hypothetical protein